MGAEERPAARGQLGDPEALTARLFRYAQQAGFRDLEVLPVKAGMLRFYRLTP
jgi:hypothetical protein